MKDIFIKGMMFGLGIIAIIGIFVPVAAIASQLTSPNNNDIGLYEQTANGYEFAWLEQDETCQEMSARLGVTVKQIQRGRIVTGYDTQIIEGKAIQVPITVKGIKVIFSALPSSVITDKLDYEAGIKGFQRAGGKSIIDTLQKVDTSVIK